MSKYIDIIKNNLYLLLIFISVNNKFEISMNNKFKINVNNKFKNRRYIFDEKSLSYKPLIFTRKQKFWKTFKWIFSSFSFGAIAFVFIFSNFDSPKEKYLKREIEFLKFNFEDISEKMKMSERVLSKIHNRDNNIYRTLLEAEPISDEIMEGGFGGIDKYKKFDGYNNSKVIKDISKRIDLLTNKLYIQSKSLDKVSVLVKDKEKMLTHIPAIQPVDDGLTRLVSGFGYRFHPILKQTKMHYGIDFAAPTGTPVYATGDAKVKISGRSSSFGKYIVLDHGYGYETLYAHLSKLNVKKYQKIKKRF